MTEIICSWIRQATRFPWLRPVSRLVVGVGVLIGVIGYVGTGPVLRGILSLDGRTIGAALFLAAVATAAAAWRWRLIATRLGVTLRWSTAVGMYYQSQFLNTVLPGGIVGDVHRAVARGQSPEGIKQTARAVAIERTAGQVVQLAVALVVLACFGAVFEGYLLAALAIGLGMIVVALVTAAASVRGRRALLREARELRAGLGSVRASVTVAIASVIVVACHVATFTIATAAVGESVPPLRMLPLAFVILLGASIPLNIGGWGPREGIAAWAFALAGFGASAGVAACTLFGVLTIISVAPGAIVTVLYAARQRRASDAEPMMESRFGPSDSPARPDSPAAPIPVFTATNQGKTP
ncbi:MAG: dolichol-P-glucose synthetase-like protein [Subtercola sp.]|nr:dolichol-P-glucose synthetase-like protein [Subtercola sp.]